MGANTSGDGPHKSQSADTDSAESASNGSTGVSYADQGKDASSPPTAVSAEAPEAEGLDGTEDGAFTGWQRIRQPFLRLPGIAQIAQTRKEERWHKKWEEEAVRFFSQKDPEDNAATRLPPQEQAVMPLLWVAEVFTPTTIDNLVAGIRDLTARMDQSSLTTHKEDLADWVLSSRRQGTFGFTPITYVTPKGRKVFASSVEGQVPAGIRYIHLHVMTLTSTTTVLTATFRLDQDRERQLEEILNHDRATFARRSANGKTFTTPNVGQQKAEAVDDWRTAIRNDAVQWMADEFPGFFCGISSDQLPTIGLLLTKDYIPWQKQARSARLNWADVLDIDHWYGYWQAKSAPNLRLNLVTRGDQRHFLMLAARQGDLVDPNNSDNERDRLNGSLYWLDVSIPFLVTSWSVPALFGELEEQTIGILDAADRAGRDKSPKALEQVQRQLLRAGLDSRIVANDITQGPGNPILDSNVPDFSEVVHHPGPRTPAPNPSLIGLWKTSQVATGKRVVQMEKDLREILSTNADLASASANLRLQRRVIWLTVVSIVIAIIAASAAVYAVWPKSSASSTPAQHSRSLVTHTRGPAIPSPTAQTP